MQLARNVAGVCISDGDGRQRKWVVVGGSSQLRRHHFMLGIT